MATPFDQTIPGDSSWTSGKEHIKCDSKTIETTITYKAAVVDQWVQEMLLLHAPTPTVVVGLDTERRPFNIGIKSATLQLCINTKCLILQLFHMDFFPESLKNFLMNPKFTFVGVEVDKHIQRLKKEYGLDCGRSAELRAMAAEKNWPLGSVWYPDRKV